MIINIAEHTNNSITLVLEKIEDYKLTHVHDNKKDFYYLDVNMDSGKKHSILLGNAPNAAKRQKEFLDEEFKKYGELKYGKKSNK